MSRRPHEYLLSVGSNVAPDRWVPLALERLRTRMEVEAVSPLYDVPAVGATDQPLFVNLAVRIATDLPPRALREACRTIETACGRRRTEDPYAPRTLDLDVVFAGKPWLGSGLPHADLVRESYVLVPCAAVWPEARDPTTGRTLQDLAAERCPGWAATHRRSPEA